MKLNSSQKVCLLNKGGGTRLSWWGARQTGKLAAFSKPSFLSITQALQPISACHQIGAIFFQRGFFYRERPYLLLWSSSCVFESDRGWLSLDNDELQKSMSIRELEVKVTGDFLFSTLPRSLLISALSNMPCQLSRVKPCRRRLCGLYWPPAQPVCRTAHLYLKAASLLSVPCTTLHNNTFNSRTSVFTFHIPLWQPPSTDVHYTTTAILVSQYRSYLAFLRPSSSSSPQSPAHSSTEGIVNDNAGQERSIKPRRRCCRSQGTKGYDGSTKAMVPWGGMLSGSQIRLK